MSRSVVSLALLLFAIVFAPAAWAVDRIHLKDGTVVEGTIAEEMEGFVWFKTTVAGVETEVIYKPEQIARIERDSASTPSTQTQQPQATTPMGGTASTNSARRSGGPKALVLTLGDRQAGKDMVGMYVTADSIRRCIPLIEEELGTDGTGILVLRINSGGGALLEIQKLSDIIEYELKPKFRVVAWIDWAISAAAMTSHCIEEIYFLRRGNYGACTGWFGALQAVKDRELEEVLYMMEKISDRGGYDHAIMRAMQVLEAPLSATIDENGETHWYQSDEGETLLNEGTRIFTFTSDIAERFGFSKGTADTIEELAKAMRVPEVQWVGEWMQGFDYPVSKAEKEMLKFRDRAKEDENRINEYWIRYQQAIQLAQGTPKENRGKFVNKAREALNLIVRMVRNNPNFALFIFNMLPEQFNEWVEQQEQLLRELMK